MNITFLIGNGFDLGVGLKTKYTNFYESYISPKIKNDLLASMIEKDYDTWANLEIALGKCLKKIEYKSRDTFLESKYNLEIALAEYLENQESQIDYNLHEKDIEVAFANTLNNFLENLPRTEKESVLNTISRSPHESLLFQFVTFNYTSVLDKCIAIIKKNNSVLKPYYLDKIPQIGPIYHIHGSTNSEMILGVNDESQIDNPEFSQDIEFKEMIIKYNLNSSIAQDKTRIVEQTISGSAVVILYGMSIGATDNNWWKFLANWLVEEAFRRLIIFTYENEDNERKHPYRTILIRNKILEIFFKRSQVKEEFQERLKKQIMVARNPNDIFSINLVDQNYNSEITNEVAVSLETLSTT